MENLLTGAAASLYLNPLFATAPVWFIRGYASHQIEKKDKKDCNMAIWLYFGG